MNVSAKTKKVGGSLMLSLPKSVVDALGIGPNQPMDLTVKDGVLTAAPIAARPTYADLLARCDLTAGPDPFEQAWMDMPSVGGERPSDTTT